ncbi:hypothetical protein F8R90_21355 [Nostoc sp. NZL]|nr:hypothetical protein [Nostoc sp. NZL]
MCLTFLKNINFMTNCPCCSNQMLRHIRLQQTYWFCRHCWQEMPNLNSEKNSNILNLTIKSTSSVKKPISVNHKLLQTNVKTVKTGISAIVNQEANTIANRAIAFRSVS